MQKFENMDVIAALEAIMHQNTAYYQSDFAYDMYHTSDRRRTMARMLAALPDMDTEMRRLANGTIAKLERMTDADFDGQRFDFTGE